MNKRSPQWLLCLGLLMTFALQASAAQFGQLPENDVSLEAYFKMDEDSRTGRLYVEVAPATGWNVYSSTQPMGGPKATKFSIIESEDYSVLSAFEPAEDPHIKFDEAFGVIVEEHPIGVTWSAPIEIADGVSPKDLEIEFKATGQSCEMESGTCILFNEMLTAKYKGALEPLALETTYEPKRAHVVWNGELSTVATSAGETIQVTLSASPTEGYKIYGYEAESQGTVAQPTRIAFSKSYGWDVSEVTASPDPNTKDVDGELQKYYQDEVSWTMNLQVPADATEGTYRFEGFVAFQNCTDAMCDPPGAAKFAFELVVGETAEAKPAKIGFTKSGRYGNVAKLADRKAREKAKLEK